MLPPAESIQFGPLTSASAAITGGACLLRGWSLYNTDQADNALIEFVDGSTATDQIVAVISLLPNESTRDYPAGAGIGVRVSLTAIVSAGTVFGTVWINPATRVGNWELVSGELLLDLGNE